MSADEKIAETLTCPHCSKGLGLEVTTKLMNESRFSFVMEPHPGELMQAKTVGGAIAQVAKLLADDNDSLGTKTVVVLEDISTTDGTITARFLLCRHKLPAEAP